jgi:hypothetical protein
MQLMLGLEAQQQLAQKQRGTHSMLRNAESGEEAEMQLQCIAYR